MNFLYRTQKPISNSQNRQIRWAIQHSFFIAYQKGSGTKKQQKKLQRQNHGSLTSFKTKFKQRFDLNIYNTLFGKINLSFLKILITDAQKMFHESPQTIKLERLQTIIFILFQSIYTLRIGKNQKKVIRSHQRKQTIQIKLPNLLKIKIYPLEFMKFSLLLITFQIRFLPFIIEARQQMASLTGNRHALKSLSVLIEPELSKQKEQEVMVFQAHSQKMDLTTAEENELYQKLLRFMEEFLLNQRLYTKMFQVLHQSKSSKKVCSQKQNEKILSFKKMNAGSRVCFDGEVINSAMQQEKQMRNQQGTVVRGNSKKISILVMEQDYSSSIEQFSDDSISENSVKTIRSIEIPQMEMNLDTISLIYDSPQPFLINLSLCLFIRYSFLTKKKVRFQESAWVLTVSTIIAYKLYYDQEIEGLIDCFAGIMKIPRQDVIDLERCFFEEIGYNTVILNYDYHFVLSTLLSMPIETKM